MKINAPMRILIAALLFVQTLSSLPAQISRRTAVAGVKPVIQQLTELLAPVQVEVTTAALAVSETASTWELRIRWVTSPTSPPPGPPPLGPPPVGSFSISDQHRYAEAPLRQAGLDLAPGHLFVAAIDKSNRLKSWTDILDPRIVRSEGAGADGVLNGQALYLEQAEFLVNLPDDPEIVELRFYQPQSEGAAISLLQVGRVPLGQ